MLSIAAIGGHMCQKWVSDIISGFLYDEIETNGLSKEKKS